MSSILIKNGTLVSSLGQKKTDIYFKNGKIKDVRDNLSVPADRIIDAEGLHVFYGVLDPQVHFREPGNTHKEDLHSGSVAAASGGVTSFFDMPNNNPSVITRELMAEKKKLASEKCVVNYNFFIGATPENVVELNETPNVNGIKIFMGSSTGTLLVEDLDDLDNIFKNGSRLIAVHAENNEIIETNKKKYENETDFDFHRKIRSADAALKATKIAVELAIKYNRRLHILHLTTKDEAEFLAQYKDNDLISCEVCPQHLLLHGPEIYEKLGSLAQMNPPIRDKSHGEGLWKALKEGTINCIATDHAPHTLEEKSQPFGKAPSGMPGVETSFPLMLNQVSEGNITLEQVADWMCENPYEIYNVQNKGKVEVGYDADLVLVDMNKVKEIKGEDLFTKVKWCAYEGMTTHGWPVMTICGGNVVFENGKVDTEHRGKEILIG